MDFPFIPENSNLKNLFEKLYGREIHTKQRAQEMYEILFDPIMTVWFDQNAKDEIVRQNWHPYVVILQHLRDQKKTFVKMDLYESLCFDLFWFIYH